MTKNEQAALAHIRRLIAETEKCGPHLVNFVVTLEDLRLLLALAERAGELRRRVRAARRLLSPLGKRYGEPADVPLWEVDRALDLSVALAPRRGKARRL